MSTPNAGVRCLIVNDDRGFAELLKTLIYESCAQRDGVEVVGSIDEAAARLENQAFDVCFLDFEMADRFGFHTEVLSRLGKTFTALVFVSDKPSKKSALRALNLGGKDFLVKSRITSFDIAKSVSYALYWKYREIEMEAAVVRDHVTGLGNVPLFDEHLRHALDVAKRGKEKVGLLMIGLTGMEPVAEDYGDEVSDQLLKQVGERISGKLRGTDVVARLSDHEFGAVLLKVASPSVVDTITGSLTGVIADKPYSVGGYTLKIGASIGSSTYPDVAGTLNELKTVAQDMLTDKEVKKQESAGHRSFSYY